VTLIPFVRITNYCCRLAQLVRFLVVKLTHSSLNLIFDMSIVFMANYFFNRRRRLIDDETFLMTDFVNLKIKPAQSFRSAHRSRIYVHMFIEIVFIHI
jgi:hypothetical protein